ncbi:MAG: glycoside hydrolase family 97 catalytic domain-containing protein [Bacteroidota bacterium]|nr:glycoside hydrolase family 97 catalytic domain-containing protein [Bacteroidota bacterium]
MKCTYRILLVVCILNLQQVRAQSADKPFSIASPDHQLECKVRLNEKTTVSYQVLYEGKEIINWSPLGLVLTDRILPSGSLELKELARSETHEKFAWLNGEKDSIDSHFRELQLAVLQEDGTVCHLIFRAFDHNLAFRYEIPAQAGLEKYRIQQELTGFRFSEPYTVYRHTTESVFSPSPIHEMKSASDFPLVMQRDAMFISINEAQNNGYTKAVIHHTDEPHSLALKFLRDTVSVAGRFQSPWRTITIARSATALCDNSDLLYKLNSPPDTNKDYRWVRPGKLIREMTLTTQGALSCIDFAQKMNLQYILFDAGWYGKGYAAEHSPDSDPFKVVPEIDLPRIIRYGKERNIGLLVYVNYIGLRKNNLDTLFTLYKSWGILGLKFGFVDGLSQKGILWLMGAVKKAQDYGFVVDVHDNYKPTGISRTMPGWLTQEGIRGNENDPDAFHNTTLPFTRFLSGPADYTFCYRNQNDSFNNALLSKKLQVSQAQQLALTVIFYSPLQSMFWYGKPADYQKPTDIEFFSFVPVTWNQTLHLRGEIGKYVVVARRKSNDWFLGAAAGLAPYETDLSLDFLDKGKRYRADRYLDDGKGGILKKSSIVNSHSTLKISLSASGGEAVRIVML